MDDSLIKLMDKLQSRRSVLWVELQELDEKINSINTVLELLDDETDKPDDKQLNFIKEDEPKQNGRFNGLSFRAAINVLFKEDVDKRWRPGEIAKALLDGGFQTKSKKFENTVRTLLAKFREDGSVVAISTKGGWLYGAKKDSAQI